MWLYLRGFFPVVQNDKCKVDEVAFGARCRDDTIPSKDRFRHDAYFGCREAMWVWQGKLAAANMGRK
jgi:hypothetical protein